MSPVIRIPDSVYERLKRIAEPFVDTPADVISKLLDSHEQQHSTSPVSVFGNDKSVMLLDSENAPPDLSHTRVLDIRVNGNTVKPKWNYLVRELHRLAIEKLGGFDEVRSVTHSNIAPDHRDDSGFKYAEELGFSIQYADSNHCWANALHLAKQFGASIEVNFEWMDKDKAAHPGKRARFVWPPH